MVSHGIAWYRMVSHGIARRHAINSSLRAPLRQMHPCTKASSPSLAHVRSLSLCDAHHGAEGLLSDTLLILANALLFATVIELPIGSKLATQIIRLRPDFCCLHLGESMSYHLRSAKYRHCCDTQQALPCEHFLVNTAKASLLWKVTAAPASDSSPLRMDCAGLEKDAA
jgi:hypothetical protein